MRKYGKKMRGGEIDEYNMKGLKKRGRRWRQRRDGRKRVRTCERTERTGEREGWKGERG